MNYILAIILTLASGFTFAFEGTWTTTLGAKAPSCSLYRHRAANFAQRIQEFELANKVLSEDLDPLEIASLVNLARRTGIPLHLDEVATWTTAYSLTPTEQEVINNPVSVKVATNEFTWETDKFLFPPELMEATLEEGQLHLKLRMNFPSACLRTTTLSLEVTDKLGRVLLLAFELKKPSWKRSL